MMQFGMNFHTAKSLFFDRETVKNKVDAATRKVLSKFGAFVRQTVKRSIRKRKRKSRPGQPPSSHTGTLKKFIYFGFDPIRRSVVIGPVVVPGKSGKAPGTLEYGGKLAVSSQQPPGRSATVGGEIQARPYMGPAFSTELSRVPNLWNDAIR